MNIELNLSPPVKEFEIKLHNIDHVLFNYPVGKHLQNDLPKILQLVNDSAKIIMSEVPEASNFNFIVRGSSGAILGTIFLQIFNTIFTNSKFKIIHIKKPGELSHMINLHYSDFEGINIFVDDFIASGSTIYKTLEEVRTIMKEPDFSFDFLIVGQSIWSSKVSDFTKLKVTKNIITHIDF